MAQPAAVGARIALDGGAISDDEANSWDEDLSESGGSNRGEDYYDQEDYDEEVSPTRKEETKGASGEDYGSEDEEDGVGGRLTMNVYCTEYDVIKKVARKGLGYKLREY